MNIGYLAAGITLVSWTVGTFAFTRASQLENPSSVNRVRLLFAFIILSILTCFYLRINPIELFTTPNFEQYLWFGISGFIGLTLGDYFAFTAYSILGGRRTSLFACFAPGAALFAAYFLVGERINIAGIIGMSISISGILLLVLSRKEHNAVESEHKGSFNKGILFAALGAICQGLGLVLAKKGFSFSENNFSPMYATWVRMFSASFFVYIMGSFNVPFWKELKDIIGNKKVIHALLLGTVFGPVIGVSFSLLAANHLDASVAQTIFTLLPASVLFTSVIFFKERVPFLSYLAVIISILGVIVLVWRNNF